MESQLHSESISSKKVPFLMQHFFLHLWSQVYFYLQKKKRERQFQEQEVKPSGSQKGKQSLGFVLHDPYIQNIF